MKHDERGVKSYVRRAMLYERGAMLYERGAMLYERGAMLYKRRAILYDRQAQLQLSIISTNNNWPRHPRCVFHIAQKTLDL